MESPGVNQRLISEIGKSQRLRLVNLLKRSQGMSVNELKDALKMSYMGTKQQCLDLEREGYLDTWRRPQKIGRPEILYRLTRRAHELFPTTSNATTLELLESARDLYGPSAAEKLLFAVFQKKTEHYRARVKGESVAEKAKWLARLRDNDGYFSEFETDQEMRIVEYHSPIIDVLRAYPIVARLEAEMFERVLGKAVQREESSASGLYLCTFRF